MAKAASLKISLSGVRGIAGESLTPNLVASFAAAFGTCCGKKQVVIGSDSRPSRVMVTHAAVAGLLSVGCVPVHVGIVPVPTLQYHIREIGAAGGICITASHNPVEWNALKFFGPDGIVLRKNQFSEVTDLYHQGIYPRVSATQIPTIEEDESAISRHREAILGFIDVDLIRSRNFKVAIDCCNGAGSLAVPDLLRRLGCEVIEVHTHLDQVFPRNPEPVRANLADLSSAVKKQNCEVGFALDADADRLAMVDECGDPLGEDCTVALVIRHMLQRKPGPVVVNLSTSNMVDAIAAEYGCPVFRTKVGEIHVVEQILRCGAVVGGEGNGGVIVPSLNPCRDSLIGIALLLESLAQEELTVRGLRCQVPQSFMVKERIILPPRHISPFLRILKHIHREEELDMRDGIKISWPDRWLHVRGSNTEPILRIVAEAKTKAEARALIAGITEYLRPVVG